MGVALGRIRRALQETFVEAHQEDREGIKEEAWQAIDILTQEALEYQSALNHDFR